MKPIKVGIVGLGYWGPNLLRNFSELPGSEVVVVCDKDNKRLATIASDKKYSGVLTATKPETIIGDKNIDAVVIATPTKTHFELAKACLNAKKNVLVEKPLTYSPLESLKLWALAQEQKKVLMVGHVFLYNSVVRYMKQQLDAGTLGKVRYMHATRTGLGPIRQDVNAMWDLAPHDVAMFNYLLGRRPDAVSATGATYVQRDKDLEDVVFATFNYPGGVKAHVMTSWIDPVKTRKLTVVGDKKMMAFDDVHPSEKLTIYDKGADYQTKTGEFGEFLQVSLRSGEITQPSIPFNEPLKEECSHFIRCVQKSENPLTDGLNGYEVVAALDAAQKSLKEGRTVEINYETL